MYGTTYNSYTCRYGKGTIPRLNRVIFAYGRLTGFQSVGWPSNIGWLTALLRTGNEISYREDVLTALLNDDPKFMVLNKII